MLEYFSCALQAASSEALACLEASSVLAWACDHLYCLPCSGNAHALLLEQIEFCHCHSVGQKHLQLCRKHEGHKAVVAGLGLTCS